MIAEFNLRLFLFDPTSCTLNVCKVAVTGTSFAIEPDSGNVTSLVSLCCSEIWCSICNFSLAKSEHMLIDFIQLHHLWLRLFLLHSPLTHCLITCNNVNVYRTLALYEKLHINIHWIDTRHDESAAAEMGAGRWPWRLVCKLQSGRKGKSNNRFWEPGWILKGTRMYCWGGFKYISDIRGFLSWGLTELTLVN